MSPDENSFDQESEISFHVGGKKKAKRTREAPIIPVTELQNVYYFQWRIDSLAH